MLKKEGLDVNHFASTVRLKKFLDRIELPEEELESLLEEINILCFKQGIDEKQFVARIDEIFQMVFELEIPIADVLVQ